MSQDSEFRNIVRALRQHPQSNARAEAARILGNYVDQLNDEEYHIAREALNNALTDSDPTVLMAAMQSLTKYNREGASAMGAVEEADDDTIAQAAACAVCGRPEVLIPEGGCERDDCPYKA